MRAPSIRRRLRRSWKERATRSLATNEMRTVKTTLVVIATVLGAIVATVSIIAFFKGGPDAVAQTWTVIVKAPTVVNEITNNIDVSEITDRLDRILRLAEDFYSSE